MKTHTQLAEWIDGAAADLLGDASDFLCQLFFRYRTLLPAVPAVDELICEYRNGRELALWIDPHRPLLLPINPDGMQMDGGGALGEFGIEKVAPGLWHLDPSLNLPEVIHAYVVLYGVPDPAPWERMIVLP